MPDHAPRRLAAACGLALALAPGAALAADDPHAACKEAAAAATAEAVKPSQEPAPAAAAVTLADVPLLDQAGASRRFASEVIGDHLVVMDFVFTTCTTICPLLSARMAAVQERLGDRVGKDVLLVSVSVDPVRDTPPRLAAYAKRWKARPGWSFHTGPKADVDAVLKGLGAYTPRVADHPPMFLVGDARAWRWVRLNGFPDVDRIVRQVDELAAARASQASATGARP